MRGLSRLQQSFQARGFSLFEIGKNHFRFRWAHPLFRKPCLPRALCLYVTYRCNLRCAMCGIWKIPAPDRGEELSPDGFRRILSDPLFSKLEYININGGEPNLREDLIEIVELLIHQFPSLKMVSLNSNGLPPDRAVAHIQEIGARCQKKKIRFSVSISLHRIGQEYDRIAGVKNAYTQVEETLRQLKTIKTHPPFYLSTNCVITPSNLANLEEMVAWGEQNDIPVNFTLGEVRDRFHNLDMAGAIEVKGEARKGLIRFLRIRADQPSVYHHHAFRYAHLADMLELNTPRALACHYALAGAILGSDGGLYYCKQSKVLGDCKAKSAHEIYFDETNLAYREQSLLGEICHRCPPNTFNRMEIGKDLFPLLKFMILRTGEKYLKR